MLKTDKTKEIKKKERKGKITEQKKELTVKKESQKFIEAVGRRKTSSARVRLFPNSDLKEIIVNGKSYKKYFPFFSWQKIIEAPLEKLNLLGKFNFSINVKGGGASSQAEACRHGITRALVLFDSSLRKTLKTLGFLTRDPRMRERKKFGLKRARRAPQWSKR